MIELPRAGYGYVEPSYVDPGDVSSIHARARHSMDDQNTTVVTLKNGTTLETSSPPCTVREAVDAATRGE